MPQESLMEEWFTSHETCEKQVKGSLAVWQEIAVRVNLNVSSKDEAVKVKSSQAVEGQMTLPVN